MFLYEGVFGVYYPPPHLTPFPLPPSPTPNQPHPPTHIPQLQATPDKGLFLVRFVFCIHSKLLMFPAVFVKAAVAEGKAVWVFVFIDCVVYSSVCVPWAIIPSGLGGLGSASDYCLIDTIRQEVVLLGSREPIAHPCMALCSCSSVRSDFVLSCLSRLVLPLCE